MTRLRQDFGATGPLTRFDALDQVRDAISRREAAYGPPLEGLQLLADLWSVRLRRPVPPHLAAILLADLKTVRIDKDPFHVDSWVDYLGWGAIGFQAAAAEQARAAAALVTQGRPASTFPGQPAGHELAGGGAAGEAAAAPAAATASETSQRPTGAAALPETAAAPLSAFAEATADRSRSPQLQRWEDGQAGCRECG